MTAAAMATPVIVEIDPRNEEFEVVPAEGGERFAGGLKAHGSAFTVMNRNTRRRLLLFWR